ncbi:peptidyl-prolyl cis-trans isomerase [Photobacterium aquae]|uniref:Peptidyl-prolyl cis-trans isomerase n=1 Tax=Photobacterium aquae TaxID=1195763 RepID=A0A0J1H4C8_9GAMM|nr:DUF1481 domain-containing protein [Photobacterium aquae]KLV06643.1 peptidyl-prolyl cis-trans isomerase [Photobacterium aquae]
MKHLIPFAFLALLAGCASTPTIPENNLTPIVTHTGGQRQGDTTLLYWYTSQQNRPVRLSDRVFAGDSGNYHSDYLWREGLLREIKRQGQALDEQKLKPYTLHVRYDTRGSAVFQRYTLAGDVIPLTNGQLEQLRKEAEHGMAVVQQLREEDMAMVQGHWKQGKFYRCGDNRELSVTFNPVLSSQLAGQVAEYQDQGFMAVNGQVRRDSLTASQLLVLKAPEMQCLAAPVLID